MDSNKILPIHPSHGAGEEAADGSVIKHTSYPSDEDNECKLSFERILNEANQLNLDSSISDLNSYQPFEVENHLSLLKKEIDDINAKLRGNAERLEKKTAENKRLSDELCVMKHRISMKRALKVRRESSSECCDHTICAIY